MSANIGKDGYQELNQENLQNAIDTQFGNGKATVIDNGDGTFTVSFIDSKKDYNITSNGVETGVNWNTAMKVARAPESQTTTSKSIIGIGTDGTPVNMDLWEYTLMDDGTYGLNDFTSLSTEASASASKGYLGTNYTNIVIPQYISEDNGKSWKEVTNMDWTFYNCVDLIQINKIPNTIKSMRYTFRECTSLEKTNNIPESVINMKSTFYGCTSLKDVRHIGNNVEIMSSTFSRCINLEKVNNIPNKVKNMSNAFFGCKKIKSIPSLPNTVQNMDTTFYQCTSLETIPVIPESVTILYQTFRGCTNLTGILRINASVNGTYLRENVKDYSACLIDTATNGNAKLVLKGSCSVLNEIFNTKSSNSNISLE